MFPSSEISVAIEKNPKANAVIAENANANKFLYFSWRTTDTTANTATSRKITAKTM